MSAITFMSRDELFSKAEREGLVCILPQSTELQIDIDQGEDDVDGRVIDALHKNGILVNSQLSTKSRGGGKHVYMQLNRPLEPVERVALQACLGSDPVREVLSFLRGNSWDFIDFVNGEAVWSAMFETPDQAARVEQWRKDRELF
jgi:hypothetical protein